MMEFSVSFPIWKRIVRLVTALVIALGLSLYVGQAVWAGGNGASENDAAGAGGLGGSIALMGEDGTGAVAQMGEESFSSLQAAFDAAKGKGQVTILLLANTTTDTITLTGDHNVILDLNGKTVRGVASYQELNSHGRTCVICNDTGVLVINDSSEDRSGVIYNATKTGYNLFEAVVNYSTLTINGGTFGSYAAEASSGSALYNAYGGNCIITGGNFYVKNDVSSVRGAVFNASDGSAGEGSTLSIRGGVFASDPSAYVAEGYRARTNGTTPETWTVEPQVMVAMVSGAGGSGSGGTGGTLYPTLGQALANAGEGQVVTLLADVSDEAPMGKEPAGTLSVALKIAVSVTLDLNGYRVDLPNADVGIWSLGDARLTVTDTSAGQTGRFNFGAHDFAVVTDGKVIDDALVAAGGTYNYNVTGCCKSGCQVVANNDATWTVVLVRLYTIAVTAGAGYAWGGKDAALGEEVTLTASDAVAGYHFTGWYFDGQRVCSDSTYTVVAGAQTEGVYEARYAVMTDMVSLSVDASRFTITGMNATQKGYQLYRVGAADTVTITYTDLAYKFLYWANANNKVVSNDASYTFTPGSNTSLHAVYAEKEACGESLVIFLSAYGQIMQSQTYTLDDPISYPAAPSMCGQTFTGWVIEGSAAKAGTADASAADTATGTAEEPGESLATPATVANIRAAMVDNPVVRVVPAYVQNGQAYTISVGYRHGEVLQELDPVTLPSGNSYVLEAPETFDGADFLYWTDGAGAVLSYSREYRIVSAVDVSAFACYGDAVEAQPTTAIVSVARDMNGPYYRINVTQSYCVPDGFSLVKTGFVRTNDELLATADALVIDGQGVTSYASTLTGAYGRFYVNLNFSSAATRTWMRSYVQYLDGDGRVSTAYSDVVGLCWNDIE